MACCGFGAFLLFAAFVLLIFASVGTPIFDSVSLLTVSKPGNARLGVWGYCIQGQCSNSKLGYDLTKITDLLSSGSTQIQGDLGDRVANVASKSLTGATKALVLHPIAAGFALIAAIFAIFSNRFGYIVASFFAVLAFICSLAVMAVNFAIFGVARNRIRDGGGDASYGSGTWVTLAATIVLFIAIFVTLFECCCGARRKSRRERDAAAAMDPAMTRETSRRGLIPNFRRNKEVVV